MNFTSGETGTKRKRLTSASARRKVINPKVTDEGAGNGPRRRAATTGGTDAC